MRRGVFLDRDGVINEERGDYTYKIEDFRVLPGVSTAVEMLHEAGFMLIVVSNQGGISKGLYTRADVEACHKYMQDQLNGRIEALFYSPYHPDFTRSLSRKPSSYLFERAMALYGIRCTRLMGCRRSVSRHRSCARCWPSEHRRR